MSKTSRDAAARLGDIEKAIQRIRLYTAGLDADGLEASFMAFDAVLMNIQVIGESVSKLPDSLKAVVDPAPPWTQRSSRCETWFPMAIRTWTRM